MALIHGQDTVVSPNHYRCCSCYHLIGSGSGAPVQSSGCGHRRRLRIGEGPWGPSTLVVGHEYLHAVLSLDCGLCGLLLSGKGLLFWAVGRHLFRRSALDQDVVRRWTDPGWMSLGFGRRGCPFVEQVFLQQVLLAVQ